MATRAGYASRSTTAMTTKRRSCTAASATFHSAAPRTALKSHWRTSPIIECPAEPQNVEMRLSESLRVVQGQIGPYRDFDRGVIAALLHEHLGGSVVFEVGDHRSAFRHPAACASTSEQNHCSPLVRLIRVSS
jgi:hypothetical protein